jgi:hypothetical protein
MKAFDNNGFLSKTGFELETAIRAQNAKELSLAEQINRDCHTLLFGSVVHREDGQEVLTATLFLRVLEHFQGVLSLLPLGVVAPGRATLRAMLEAVFATRSVAADESFVRRFISTDLLVRRKMMNLARNNSYVALESLREALTPELISELSAEISRRNAQKISAEELARSAGMHDWYVSLYTHLSAAVHTSVRDLESYLELDGTEIRALRYAPQLNDIGVLIHTASHAVLMAADAVDNLFQRGLQPTIDAHLALLMSEDSEAA